MQFTDIEVAFTVAFVACAACAWVLYYFRKSLIIAYISAGVLISPVGFNLLHNQEFISALGEIGVTLLLFSIGLEIGWRGLLKGLQQPFVIVIVTSGIFSIIGFLIFFLAGFNNTEAIIGGILFSFSSTVIAVGAHYKSGASTPKSTTMLINILLLQDILVLLFMQVVLSLNTDVISLTIVLSSILRVVLVIPLFFIFAVVLAKFIVNPLCLRIAHNAELYMLTILAYAFAMIFLGHQIGVSEAVAAFLAGVSVQVDSPFSHNIHERLKYLKELFLIFFFVAVGARINVTDIVDAPWNYILLVPIFTAFAIFGKRIVYIFFFKKILELRQDIARNLGEDLSNYSEFVFIVLGAFLLQDQLFSEHLTNLMSIIIIVVFVTSSIIQGLKNRVKL